jgi:predicted lipoprotein with Yx(FWY)xxD motif
VASTLVLARSNPKLGTILVDAKDMALYTYAGAAAGSRCTGVCLEGWRPLLLPPGARAAVAGAGVTGLGTLARSNGIQVTFDGKPLYTYVGDSPGQTKGQGVADAGGVWSVAVLKAPAAAPRTVAPGTAATAPPVTMATGTAPSPTTPPATHPAMTRAPTRTTAIPAPVTPAPTMAPATNPPATHAPTTPAPTTPRTTVPPTTIPGGVSY